MELIRWWLRAGMAACVAAAIAYAATDRPVDVGRLSRDPSVRAALAEAKATEPQTIADQIRFCEIPAPPFKESARAEALKASFAQLGLANVRVDAAGNVLGDRPGASPRPHLIVAAHLDTVFPEETPIRITRNGALLRGPGIGDNCRGLAVLVATIRALQQARVATAGSITFVADVGEEGVGDLRGVKQLFERTLKEQIDRFLSIDGAGLFVANVAVASRRYLVTFKGAGGHSFADFGAASPIQAMGRAIAKISAVQPARSPRTTFNIGRVGGGTSINAVPAVAWMEIDLRSSDAAALASLERQVLKAIDDGVGDENGRSHTSQAITVVKDLVGDRPGGSTSLTAPIVQTALGAARAIGITITPTESSTDANVPIQLKVPAITIGAGGSGTHAHSTEETFDTTDARKGTEYAVLLTIALAR